MDGSRMRSVAIGFALLSLLAVAAALVRDQDGKRTEGATEVASILTQWDVYAVALTADGKRIVAGGWDKSAMVWDATSGRAVATLRGFIESVNAVTFSRDGERVITGDGNGFVKVWALKGPSR